jgi:hypothetical protein
MFGEMSLLASGLFPTDSTSTTIRSDATLSTIGSEVLQFDSAWLDNIFDGNVPSTLESAPLSPWYTETIEKILSEHIPATACSIEELKHKIENDSLKTNYLAAKNRQIQGRRSKCFHFYEKFMHQMYHHFISRLVRDGSQPF